MDNIPFPITKERQDFAQKCIKSYQKYFPEVLDEIKGIAKGQGCKEDLQAVLLSMYCLMPSTHCSCFAARSKGGVVLGRNSDFLTEIEKLYMNVIYTFYKGSYSFTANTTAFFEMEDGINEKGLSIGLTSVAPLKVKPGLNADMLLRLFLEKCQSVDDVITLITKIPIASSQTLICVDRHNRAVLIECSCDHLEIQRIDDSCSFVCATNMFNLPCMKQYNCLPEDNWQAEERYQTLTYYLSQQSNVKTVNNYKNLLAGKYGFLCQYDRTTGKDTVWSVIYDYTNRIVERVEGNPRRKQFKQDKRFLL